MIKWKVEIEINDKGFGVNGSNTSHFKNDANAIDSIRKEINRYLKDVIEKERDQDRRESPL